MLAAKDTIITKFNSKCLMLCTTLLQKNNLTFITKFFENYINQKDTV